MKEPDLLSGFEFDGHVDVAWYDVGDVGDIPDHPWHHVYVVGNLDGNTPVVISSTKPGKYNLPGGRTEPGETIEETLRREVEEELNMEVLSWCPIGYQVCTRPDSDEVSYQFRVYARLKKIGDFISDPGGHIIGHELIQLDQLNDYIQYGEVGERIIKITKEYMSQES